uniref:Uncharacterized protein n=1 Tax=Anopheles dirus TaxID=7168 RepID=A0A182NW74_9DIPT
MLGESYRIGGGLWVCMFFAISTTGAD